MDEPLHRLHATAPSFDGGMSNHAPMVLESLETAGLQRFAGTYLERVHEVLEPVPPAADGERTFGDREEAGWIEAYRDAIASRSVEEVVREALPALLPGVMAGATHGLIRTGHALRGWRRHASAVRATEVAHALGYWAAWFQELPGTVGVEPSVGFRTAMETLPGLTAQERSGAGFIFDRVRDLDGVSRFADAIARVDLRDLDTGEFLSDMVGIAARMMLTTSGGGFAQLHAITATAAVRELLPYVEPVLELEVRKAVFHAVAALHAAHGSPRAWIAWEPPAVLPDPATLPLRAAQTGSDHAIKLAVAATCEYSLRPDPALLCAAEAEVEGC